MKIKKTKFKGLLVLNGVKHEDKRGYLRELVLEKLINRKFKFQILSVSKKNVLRGLHFQIRKPQGKLISVIKGEIFDVAVDIRQNSETFGKHFSIRLNDENCTSVFIPPGFAHGFLVLSNSAELFYKCTEYYHPEDDHSLLWNDPAVGIEWPIQNKELILSEKDRIAQCLSQIPVYSG